MIEAWYPSCLGSVWHKHDFGLPLYLMHLLLISLWILSLECMCNEVFATYSKEVMVFIRFWNVWLLILDLLRTSILAALIETSSNVEILPIQSSTLSEDCLYDGWVVKDNYLTYRGRVHEVGVSCYPLIQSSVFTSTRHLNLIFLASTAAKLFVSVSSALMSQTNVRI